MRQIAVLAVLLLPLLSPAATISSTSCTSPNLTGCVTLSLVNFPANTSAVAVQVTGTWVGTLEFQGSVDGTNYTTLRGYPVGGGSYASEASANGAWTALTSGLLHFRVRATSWSSGSATVTLNPTAAGVVPDVVRAVGPTFGEVQVSGTMDLSSATLASMGNFICTVSRSPRVSLTTTATNIPTTPLTNRTSITLINADGTKNISCERSISGSSPNCSAPGFGTTLYPNGGTITIPVRDSDTVKCVACVTGATLEYVEEACVAP